MAYDSWDDLEKNETEGTTYSLESNTEQSNWAHIAPHGGNIELLSLELAKAVAEERRQSYAALKVLEEEDPERLKIGERNYDAPWALDMMGSAQWGITYHSIGDPVGDDPQECAYVGGLSTGHRDLLIEGFKDLGIFSRAGSKEGNSDSENALVNKTKNKKGVRIELSRALRDKLVVSGNSNDTSKGFTDLWRDIIAVIVKVTGPADVYQSWESLSGNEKEGEDFRLEKDVRSSRWSHIAIHGGKAETLTAEIAKAVADERKQKYYAFIADKDKYNDRLRIPAVKFDEPSCLEVQESVESSISYHGVSGNKDEVRVNGLDEEHQKKLVSALKESDFTVTTDTTEAGSKTASDPKNICNRTKSKKGLHVELTRSLRDKMSASGDATDLSQGTSQLFTTFVRAVSSVTGSLDVHQSWGELEEAETEGEDYRVEIERRGSAYSHLAIHGGEMELITRELAENIAKKGEQNYYALVGMKDDYNDRLQIPADKYDEPQALKLQSEVDFSISYHGHSDRKGDPKGGVARVGGRRISHRDRIIKALNDKGFTTQRLDSSQSITAEEGGVPGEANESKKNIVNRNRQKAGVQIEMNRTLRDAMSASGSASDLREGTTELFARFVEAVTEVTVATDRHQSWESFEANEKEGEHYRLDYVRNPESSVAHIAIHGGSVECMTTELAEKSAAPKDQNFFSLIGTRARYRERLRMPSTLFAEPTCVEMQKAVYFTFSYHGHGNRDGDPEGGVVYVGGMDIPYRDEVAEGLRKKGFNVEIGGREWGSTKPEGAEEEDNESPDNIANMNEQPGAVQLELNRSLRDRMSASGNACDLSQGTTKLFDDFVSVIRSVANKPDAPERESGDQKCIRYFINDFNLDQPRIGYKLLQETQYAPELSPRLFNLDIPAWHGQVPMWHDPLDSAKVSLEVQVTGRTTSELRQRWDDFVGLCGVGKFVPVRLERYRGIYLTTDTEYDPHDRNRPLGEYAHARLESMTAPEFEAGNQRVTTTVVFEVPAGVWRSHKEYYQYFTAGGGQRCVVAKVSTAPVYAVMVRVQAHKNLDTWSLIDDQSQTGIAWGKPEGVTLKEGQWIYADTNTMRAYISSKREWPDSGESFGDFVKRIKGSAAWSDFRYIRNGPLNLTSKVEWKAAEEGGEEGMHHTSGLTVNMLDAKGKTIKDLEVGVKARAARI